jgi:hypothetical protein
MSAFGLWREAAANRKEWRDGGRSGEPPAARVAPHEPQEVPHWARVWARPFYRAFVDPDGRPGHLREDRDF